MSAQLHYMKRYLADGFVQLLKGNIDFFDKVIQTILLPRILLLGITPLAVILSLLPGPGIHAVYWLCLWVVSCAAILIAVPAQYFNRQLVAAVCNLPLAFWMMFKLFFKLGNANKTFIHTPHGQIN